MEREPEGPLYVVVTNSMLGRRTKTSNIHHWLFHHFSTLWSLVQASTEQVGGKMVDLMPDLWQNGECNSMSVHRQATGRWTKRRMSDWKVQ